MRLKLLQEIDFDWDPLETDWWDKFETYRRHAQNCGVYVTSDAVYEGKSIGRWVISQRDANMAGKLSEERKNLLLSIDPDFFSKRKSGPRKKK